LYREPCQFEWFNVKPKKHGIELYREPCQFE
jgi:hypothetical protein